jgi:malate dehydrogenase (oxaloacetate-decarboxylating)(NADP+)
MSDDLAQAALDYHRCPKPGKLVICATKPLANQRDLALACSPGVAAACKAIEADPVQATAYTTRGNLVAVSPMAPRCWALGLSGPWRPSR